MTHKPPQGIDAPNCAHKQLKKQMVGEFVYYACECGQKFAKSSWIGLKEAEDAARLALAEMRGAKR